MDFLKYYKPPFRYCEHGQSIQCGNGKALDVRGWGMLVGLASYNLPMDEGGKIQDYFGQWVADTLNEVIKESES